MIWKNSIDEDSLATLAVNWVHFFMELALNFHTAVVDV